MASALLTSLDASAVDSSARPSGPWQVLAEQELDGLQYRILATVLEVVAREWSTVEELFDVKFICPGSIDPDGEWVFVLTVREVGGEIQSSERVLFQTRGGSTRRVPHEDLGWMAALAVTKKRAALRISWILMSSPGTLVNRIYAFESKIPRDSVASRIRGEGGDLWAQAQAMEMETPSFAARLERTISCYPSKIRLDVADDLWELAAWPDYGSCGQVQLELDTSLNSGHWRIARHDAAGRPINQVFPTDGCEATKLQSILER